MIAAVACFATSCIDDAVSTAAADAPVFADDTLRLGRVWAGEQSATVVTTLYNRADKKITIDRLSVTDCTGGSLLINVDGFSGTEFSGIDIRANDSIYILAEVVPDGNFAAKIRVTANGVTSYLPVTATTLTPTTLTDFTVSGEMTIAEADVVRIFGKLRVAPDATLHIRPGASLYFHDGASLTVDGRIDFVGTPESNISLGGDRLTDVIKGIPFDVMAGQWEGITFGEGSVGNAMQCTLVRNTRLATTLLPGSELSLNNCLFSNSQADLVSLDQATLRAEGTEFSNAAGALLNIAEGHADISRSTFANYYLFALPSAAAITIDTDAALSVDESIIAGDCSPAAIPDGNNSFTFRNTLFHASGSDDQNFIDCIWNADPLFLLDLDNYIMDFRLDPDSPARQKASSSRTDRLAISGTALGAYN